MSEEFEVSFDAIAKKIDSADLYLPRPEFKKLLASYRYFPILTFSGGHSISPGSFVGGPWIPY
jgi:hypothetical protein